MPENIKNINRSIAKDLRIPSAIDLFFLYSVSLSYKIVNGPSLIS